MRRLLVLRKHLAAGVSARTFTRCAGAASAVGVAGVAAVVTPPEHDLVELENSCGGLQRGCERGRVLEANHDAHGRDGDNVEGIRVALYSGREVTVPDGSALRRLGPEDKSWFRLGANDDDDANDNSVSAPTPTTSSPAHASSGAGVSCNSRYSTPGLDSMLTSADDSLVRELAIDPHSEECMPNTSTRQVFSGHYVHVTPTKLEQPYLVAYSPAFAAELGLDGAACLSPRFLQVFSGDTKGAAGDLQPWCTPYAVSVYGQPILAPDTFGTGNAYGDGRAVSLGEWARSSSSSSSNGNGSGVDGDGHRWELQLKGGGTTPFARGHDGRAVLRSSVREFLVSEAMHALGVRTTRALSLVASKLDTVGRAWYPPGYSHAGDVTRPPFVMQEERCAITCRAAPSFIRVGHFELYARRAAKGDPDAREQLAELFVHAIRREYPEMDDGTLSNRTAQGGIDPAKVAGFTRRVMQQLATLSVGWVRTGYVQGNMNSDNCAVGGRTIDYGPVNQNIVIPPVFHRESARER